MKETIRSENHFGIALYPRRGLVLVRGKGATLWDDNGNAYVDCMAGQGVGNIGHCNDVIINALHDQAQKLMICTGSFYNDVRARLIEKLISLSPERLIKVFLCNSGTESVEAALKFARVSTGKTGFICAMRGFHGRTFGALSATHNKKYREPFEPLVPGFDFVPYNNYEKLEAAVNETTAAVLLEPVQGEGGIHPGDPVYFQAVQKLCNERGMLLIIDEIQTGFCRTGSFFAIEQMGIEPDMLLLAKSIAGGMPMGAVLCSEKVKVSFGMHGTTFGGNPLACAAALAAIGFMQENDLARQAKDKGAYFMAHFPAERFTRIREVRQRGLMIGIELKEKVQPYIDRMQQNGVLVLPAGPTVLRLLPPLMIEYAQLDRVIEVLIAVLK